MKPHEYINPTTKQTIVNKQDDAVPNLSNELLQQPYTLN